MKQATYDLPNVDGTSQDSRAYPPTEDKKWVDDVKSADVLPPSNLRPNRRRGDDVELGGVGPIGLTETNLTMHNLHYRNVNPMVSNFTSPIGGPPHPPSLPVLTLIFLTDFAYQGSGGVPVGSNNNSRLTFTRK